MVKLTIAALFLMGASDIAAQDGFYVGIGAGVHSEKYDCPEVCYGGDALVKFTAGHTWEFGKWEIEAELMHQSNPEVTEQGWGLNSAMGNIKRYF